MPMLAERAGPPSPELPETPLTDLADPVIVGEIDIAGGVPRGDGNIAEGCRRCRSSIAAETAGVGVSRKRCDNALRSHGATDYSEAGSDTGEFHK
jgi:hypothetical protein